MSPGAPYGQGTRMLALGELCEWLNITERHARKLVERNAIPYRKVGHLLRFAEAEINEWSRPKPRRARPRIESKKPRVSAIRKRSPVRVVLPKSLIEWTEQEDGHDQRRWA
jgi:excisionase family DNA binding protein